MVLKFVIRVRTARTMVQRMRYASGDNSYIPTPPYSFELPSDETLSVIGVLMMMEGRESD